MADEADEIEQTQDQPEDIAEDEGAAAASPADPTEARFSQLESGVKAIQGMLEQLASQRHQPAPERMSEDEKLRLDLMDPTERAIHELSKKVDGISREVQHTAHRTGDQIDFSDFHSKASSGKHPAHSKYATQVEEMVKALRQQGKAPPPRELMLYTLVGKESVNRASQGAGKPVKKGSDATAARVPGKGDQGAQAKATKGDEATARRLRLSNMTV